MSLTATPKQLGALALLLATAGCQATPVTTSAQASLMSSPAPTPSPSTARQAPGTLSGLATVPIIAAGSGNIIAAGSGNIIAAGAYNIIAAGAYNLVGVGDGHIIAAGAYNYRGLHTLDAGSADELPVLGAVAYLRDPVTRRRVTGIKPVLTDERGAFAFTNLPAGVNYLVEVDLLTPDAKGFRLLSLASAGGASVPLSWRSTAVASALLDGQAASGLYVADLAAEQTAAAAMDAAMAGVSVSRRQAIEAAAIAMPRLVKAGAAGLDLTDKAAQASLHARLAASGKADGAPNMVLALPDDLPVDATAGGREAVADLASNAPALAQQVVVVQTTARAEAPAAQQAGVMSARQAMGSASVPVIASSTGTTGTATAPGTATAAASGGSAAAGTSAGASVAAPAVGGVAVSAAGSATAKASVALPAGGTSAPATTVATPVATTVATPVATTVATPVATTVATPVAAVAAPAAAPVAVTVTAGPVAVGVHL